MFRRGCFGGGVSERCFGGLFRRGVSEGCFGGVVSEGCFGGVFRRGCFGGVVSEGCFGGVVSEGSHLINNIINYIFAFPNLVARKPDQKLEQNRENARFLESS